MNKMPYPVLDGSDFKAWSLLHPNARQLLKEIIFRWRGFTFSVRGKEGKWAAWPRETWADWSGLTFEQTKDALAVLRRDGMILSKRHRVPKSGVQAFIMPTKLALKYLGRPQVTLPPPFIQRERDSEFEFGCFGRDGQRGLARSFAGCAASGPRK